MPIIIHMTTSLQGYGQSIWLDFISRKMIATGQLARLVADEDVVGVTSNPTIFEKAIVGSTEYTAQIEEIRREALELPSRQVYERLIAKDIRDTADVLRPVFDRTRGGDGYVSVEVSPGVADDTDATVSEARHLWEVIARPNLMIKVPGTAAGVPAVRSLIAEASTSTSRCCSGARCTRRSRAPTSKGSRIARAGRAPTGQSMDRQRGELLRQPHRHQRRHAAG